MPPRITMYRSSTRKLTWPAVAVGNDPKMLTLPVWISTENMVSEKTIPYEAVCVRPPTIII